MDTKRITFLYNTTVKVPSHKFLWSLNFQVGVNFDNISILTPDKDTVPCVDYSVLTNIKNCIFAPMGLSDTNVEIIKVDSEDIFENYIELNQYLNGKTDKLNLIHTIDSNVETLCQNWNNLNFSLGKLFTLWNQCDTEIVKNKFLSLYNILSSTDRFISKTYLKRLGDIDLLNRETIAEYNMRNVSSKVYMFYMSNDNYLISTLCAYVSLIQTHPMHQVYCAITNKVSWKAQYILKKWGLQIIAVDEIEIPEKFQGFYASVNKETNHWYNAYGKIAIFALEQFKKIVFIDSDVFVYQNIDDLFNYNHLAAVQDTGYLLEDKNIFNSGVMVIEPSKTELSNIIKFSAELPDESIRCEQELLNKFYTNWTNIPTQYNVNPFEIDKLINKINFDIDSINIIHYIGKKPWEYDNTFFNANLRIVDVDWVYRTYSIYCYLFMKMYNKIKHIEEIN
mgnify:FL=1